MFAGMPPLGYIDRAKNLFGHIMMQYWFPANFINPLNEVLRPVLGHDFEIMVIWIHFLTILKPIFSGLFERKFFWSASVNFLSIVFQEWARIWTLNLGLKFSWEWLGEFLWRAMGNFDKIQKFDKRQFDFWTPEDVHLPASKEVLPFPRCRNLHIRN